MTWKRRSPPAARSTSAPPTCGRKRHRSKRLLTATCSHRRSAASWPPRAASGGGDVSSLKILSLCSGYGGLDMAVRHVFGGELAYWSDIDPGPIAVMQHHYPDVPNL